MGDVRPRHHDPDFIYKKGFQVAITSHCPPPPFGHPRYKENAPKDLGPIPTASDNQLDYVFKVHPIKTKQALKLQQATLLIEENLPSGKDFGAQAFICKVHPPEVAGSGLVFAKIYDPLYYRWVWHDYDLSFHLVVTDADVDYSREAAAYEHAREKQYDGRLTPTYHGSWTFDLRSSHGKYRPVRLILTEYIHGQTLHQAYYHKWVYKDGIGRTWLPPNLQPEIPDKLRLAIFEKALVIWLRQLDSGLNQKDFAPRNVIALLNRGDGTDTSTYSVTRVVLIDYNISIVSDKIQGKRLNPLESLWDGTRVPEWEAWMPVWWQEDEVQRRQWLCHTFGSPNVLREYRDISPEIWEAIRDWQKTHAVRHDHNN